MSGTPTLVGDGIILRPLVHSDAGALFIALSDRDVQLYRRADAHASVAETEAYITDTLTRSHAAWAITEDGGEALGRLALREIAGVGEFGIVIRAAAHGRGLGHKAIALAETFAFGSLGLTKLVANIDAENAASLALFAKAGFVREALLAGDRATKRGARDSVMMAKLTPRV